MLTIAKLGAETAHNYYKQEFTAAANSYFAQDGQVYGQWSGAAAERLGLSGRVTEEAFHRLMDGQHPLNGEQLIRHRNTELSREGKETPHTPAWDITLSVPKSFSIAATVGGDDRIYRAAEIANREALAALEPYTQARGGGRHLAINTGEAAIATFRHETSRPVDGYAAGQLHFHNVMGNITYDQSSHKFRSVQSAEIFKAKSYAMEVFYNSLARQGRELGYRIDFTPGTYAPEIRGISRAYIEHEKPAPAADRSGDGAARLDRRTGGRNHCGSRTRGQTADFASRTNRGAEGTR